MKDWFGTSILTQVAQEGRLSLSPIGWLAGTTRQAAYKYQRSFIWMRLRMIHQALEGTRYLRGEQRIRAKVNQNIQSMLQIAERIDSEQTKRIHRSPEHLYRMLNPTKSYTDWAKTAVVSHKAVLNDFLARFSKGLDRVLLVPKVTARTVGKLLRNTVRKDAKYTTQHLKAFQSKEHMATLRALKGQKSALELDQEALVPLLMDQMVQDPLEAVEAASPNPCEALKTEDVAVRISAGVIQTKLDSTKPGLLDILRNGQAKSLDQIMRQGGLAVD